MDKIGYFKGKGISTMTHDELLHFALWSGKRIVELERMEKETEDFRINKELLK